MLRQMVFAVSICINGMYSGSMWGEGEGGVRVKGGGGGRVSVHCELGVE